ncbi:hypothetical protein [Ruegeria atlantica]|uniref:hypothetical protein n=1 Tax=Ruegeria atlantica TaxID=81569 RepID=UPI00147F804C|nr:hypothetical protein [Ruegeria atlantica]
MGVRDLFFAIKARDETGAAFDAVRANLRGIDGLTATTSDRLMRMGRGLVGFGAAATAATAPIFLAFRDSLSLYDQQEQAEAKVAQAIKATGGAAQLSTEALLRQATALQGITRFGDEEILNGVTAQLLTFTNIAGDQFLMAQERALDLATTLDGDLQSASIMLGKALNDPVKGLSAMSRAGITFSQDQAKVIKALAETGEIAAAQNLILEELEKQYGGQAQAAAEAGLGAMAQLSNAWGDLKEEVGAVVAELLPPITGFFREMVSGFQSLPEPMQKTVVVMGLVTAAAGPLALALGGLSIALTALTGPVGLVIAGVGAAIGVMAALWPETDNAAASTDVLTQALGDEITQSQLLAQALGTNTTMSVDAARKKLAEARARHENVAAIIAEHRALALGSDEYANLTEQIERTQAGLNSLGFPAIDVAVPINAERFEEEQQALADLLVERQRLLEADEDMTEQLKLTEENIRTLEEALESAEGGTVSFGDGLLTPIVPAERLKGSLGGLKKEVSEVKDEFEEDSKAITQALVGMFDDGRLTLDDFRGFILDWGDRVLDDVLTQVFDPIGSALADLAGNLLGGFGGGGGGGFLSSIGGFAKGLLGMDTGGEMEVTGRSGIDRNVAAFRVSADENIKVVKRGNPDGGRPVNVYIQTPDPAAFKASKGQIAAQMSRAVGRGARNT